MVVSDLWDSSSTPSTRSWLVVSTAYRVRVARGLPILSMGVNGRESDLRFLEGTSILLLPDHHPVKGRVIRIVRLEPS